MKLREDLNNLVKKYQRGGLKRLLDEENISDSNSTINYAKLRNINPTREIKKQTQKIENVQKKNNVSRKKALEIIQKEEFNRNIARNPQSVGEISIPEDQSTISKTWEVLTNPVTAASYWLNDQRIPDRFSKGERNNLDIATDLFNPFGIVDSAKNAVKETISIPKNLYNGEYGEAGSNFLNAGLNTLSVVPALRELKGTNAPISKLYNKIATGESALPIAWKSPIKNMTQEKSFNLFNQIKQSHDFTDAEKVLLAEYQFDSAPFTGRYENRFSPEKREALQKMIEKSKIEFPDDIVLSRRFNVQNSEVNGFKNSKHFEIGDRPSSFSSGIGAKDIADSPDRLIISGRNAKKIQDNFLKSIYEPLPEEVVDNIENYTDLKKTGFTGKPETYTTASGTENTIYPINDGFVRTFHNSTKEEKELIGSGFNLKKIGRVKNELGGHDYIMKPIEVPKDSYDLENARSSLAGDLNESFGFLGKNAKRFAKTLPIKLLPGHSDRAEKALELGNNWNRDWYNNPITQDRLTNIINHSNFLERIDWKNMQEAIKDEAYISHFQSNLGKINRFLDGKSHFHNDNKGFSITELKESLDPMAPLNKNGTQSFVDKYQPPSEIKLTAIHEGNHNVYSDDSFSGNIFSSMLNKNHQKPLRNIPANKLAGYDNYLSTPEEIYARIQEIRAENKLAPGELLTDKMVDEIFNKGLNGKSNVDPRFYQLIDKDKFKKVVNVVPAVGAVGIGASAVSEKKLGGYRKSLDGLVEKYQKGGSMESKWEYSVTNNTLLPQSQLKSSELGYLKDWLASPMAKKIAVKREGESGLTNLNTRLDRLSDSNLEISTAEDLLKSTNSYTRRRGEKFNNKDLQGTSYTNPSTKYGNIVTRRMAPENVILHEGAHQSTSGNSLLLKNDIEDILSRVRDDSGSYLSNPTEVHARLNVLRKELKDSGVVDPFKTPVNKEHLNKFLNNYKKPGENSDKPLIEANSGELLNILNSQDDAVWLLNNIVDNSNNMNNVAKNTKKNNNIVYSKKGGEIRNSLNNLSKKFL